MAGVASGALPTNQGRDTMNRRQLPVIAVLVLAACPVLATQPALRCADLSPESFTDAQYVALERQVTIFGESAGAPAS